jgi:hypothetical protein
MASFASVSIMGMATLALVACGAGPEPQTDAPGTETTQEQSAPAVAPAGGGLGDLDGMTQACAKAGLNAAARQAAEVPAQGTYQFSYFEIINDSHHAAYEVHFKSNYQGEPDLKYCVAIYCQQGWDPSTTEAEVTPMSDARPAAGGAAHGASCGDRHAPAKRRLQR